MLFCSFGLVRESFFKHHPYIGASLKIYQEVNEMKKSIYQSYDDLPLFLNAELIAKVLGVAPSSAYELMHEKGFPVIRVGNRLIVPKEKFREWVDSHFAK